MRKVELLPTRDCEAGYGPAFIFYPLLTVIAACMGVKASVNVNTEWTEPMILWTVVAARKGEKKLLRVNASPKPSNNLKRKCRKKSQPILQI